MDVKGRRHPSRQGLVEHLAQRSDSIEQLAVGRILDQLDLHARPPFGGPLQKRGEDAGAHTREDASGSTSVARRLTLCKGRSSSWRSARELGVRCLAWRHRAETK